MRIEIRPGDGGADAAAFAVELGTAIAKHAATVAGSDGTTVVLHRL